VFTARYGMIPHIKLIRLVFKRLKNNFTYVFGLVSWMRKLFFRLGLLGKRRSSESSNNIRLKQNNSGCNLEIHNYLLNL